MRCDTVTVDVKNDLSCDELLLFVRCFAIESSPVEANKHLFGVEPKLAFDAVGIPEPLLPRKRKTPGHHTSTIITIGPATGDAFEEVMAPGVKEERSPQRVFLGQQVPSRAGLRGLRQVFDCEKVEHPHHQLGGHQVK